MLSQLVHKMTPTLDKLVQITCMLSNSTAFVLKLRDIWGGKYNKFVETFVYIVERILSLTVASDLFFFVATVVSADFP